MLDGELVPRAERGTATAAPSFRPMPVVAKRMPISATAEIALVMAGLWNRAGHYVFALCFISSLFIFSLAYSQRS